MAGLSGVAPAAGPPGLRMIYPVPSALNMAFRLKPDEGIVEPVEPRRNRVAILGATPTNRHAPLEDPSWEIWGLNRILSPHYDWQGRFRADRWFELHPMSVQSREDLAWIRTCPVPLYTLGDHPELPLAVRFPLGFVEDLGRDLFSCTFCYQIALAVAEGFKVIGLYGVDLDLGDYRERTLERACVLWWLGFAEGRGVSIVLPKESRLLNHPKRYGYDYHAEVKWCREYLRRVAQEMGDGRSR